MKSIAKTLILSRILGYPSISSNMWESNFHPETTPILGDIISINSAPFNKFYLSLVLDFRTNEDGYPEYLLESYETGETCWWSNIGINVLKRDLVKEHPEWKWTDEQAEFFDRIDKLAIKTQVLLIKYPIFNKDKSVIIEITDKFREPLISKIFDNWEIIKDEEVDTLLSYGLEKYLQNQENKYSQFI